MSDALHEVLRVYEGSDGEATKALYALLEQLGPIGNVAVNLFRACKASERAKKYRGGQRGGPSYRSLAYDRKQWSIDNLCAALGQHAESIGLIWGWGTDSAQAVHSWALYCDLPTGQCSFHTAIRGTGPAHPTGWDNRKPSVDSIIRWVARLLDERIEAAA